MFSCETAAGGPHARALAIGAPAAIVTLGASDAYGIAGPVVCVATSSGFKDVGVGSERFPVLENPTLHDLAPDA
ncbi:hypothetical protein AB0K16_58345 [Nonomuraea jabiensis]|uniref:hypothetical protein n=1 Tax=Nonomuraea jabiensis TaxID=882448 RepID=UPI003413CD2E